LLISAESWSRSDCLHKFAAASMATNPVVYAANSIRPAITRQTTLQRHVEL
jgi:hypothetical protein